MTTRRRFLSGFGLGLLGSAAVLLRPGKLLAGWYGGACVPPPCAGGYPVFLPGDYAPLSPLLTAEPAQKRIRLGTPITLSYPPSGGGVTIPGGGDFCIWGMYGGTGVSITGIQFSDSSGNKLAQQPQSYSALINGIIGGDWGYAVANYSGVTFWLKVSYVQNGTPGSQLFGGTNGYST